MNEEGVMKIENDHLSGVIQNLKASVVRGDETAASRVQGGGIGADRVDFSISRDVDHYRKILEGMPEVRNPKIDELKPAVAAGAYGVEAGVVARKMLETAW